jgi:predicted lipoprotein
MQATRQSDAEGRGRAVVLPGWCLQLSQVLSALRLCAEAITHTQEQTSSTAVSNERVPATRSLHRTSPWLKMCVPHRCSWSNSSEASVMRSAHMACVRQWG